MKNCSELKRNIILCVVALSIPFMLALDGIQARRYSSVESEIEQLVRYQTELIENNKNLITGISVLSSADRIEELASTQLNMRLAETNEIIREEMNHLGGDR